DTNWETTNEAWRFTPNGAAIIPSNITWYEGSVAVGNEIPSNGDNSVTVNAANSYFAVAEFNTCSGPVTLTDEIIVDRTSKTWVGHIDNNWYVDGNWEPIGVLTVMDCVLTPDVTIANLQQVVADDSYFTSTSPPVPAFALNLSVASTATLKIDTNKNLAVTYRILLDGTSHI